MQINSNKKKIFCWKTFGWACLVVFVLFLLLSFPVLFNFFAIHFWHVPESELSDYTKLGPIGDIYGSLNTLFTSATLAFVVYATLLQRQANNDAREAMVKQLRQAQLSTKRQLALAQATHQEQLKESQINFFKSQFYLLLNYKNDKFKELSMNNKNGIELKGYELFSELFKRLNEKIIVKFKANIEDIDEKVIRFAFDEACHELNNNENYYEIFTYLEIYAVIIKLINSSKADQNDINFYGDILKVSISKNEQLCIFLLAPMWDRLYSQIKLVAFFNSFGTTRSYEDFAFKFYQKGNFALEVWQEAYEKKEKN